MRPSTALVLAVLAAVPAAGLVLEHSGSSPSLTTEAQPAALAQPLSNRLLAPRASRGFVPFGPPTAVPATGRLRGLGLVAGLTQQLHGLATTRAVAVSVVEQFHSAAGARSELADQDRPVAGRTLQRLSGIPGAVQWTARYDHGTTGINVAFTTGSFYYLVGAAVTETGHGAPTRASLVAAARFLYLSANGCVAPRVEARLS